MKKNFLVVGISLAVLSFSLVVRAVGDEQNPTRICYGAQEQVATYQKNSSLQEKWGKDLIEIHEFLGQENIIDIGGGTGRDARILAELLPSGRVHSIDNSSKMIAQAEKGANYSNLTFEECSILDVQTKNSYDVAFTNCCLHWLSAEDHSKALSNIHAMLVPQGVFLFVGPGMNDKGVFACARLVSQTDTWKEDFKSFICPRSYYTKQEYVQMLKDIGFEKIDFEEVSTQTSFNGCDQLSKWISSCSPFVQYLKDTPDLQEQFLSDVVAEVLRHSPADEEGTILLQSIKLQGKAYKKNSDISNSDIPSGPCFLQ